MNRRRFIAGLAAAALTTAVITRLAPVLQFYWWRVAHHAYWHEQSQTWTTFHVLGFDEASALARARSDDLVHHRKMPAQERFSVLRQEPV